MPIPHATTSFRSILEIISRYKKRCQWFDSFINFMSFTSCNLIKASEVITLKAYKIIVLYPKVGFAISYLLYYEIFNYFMMPAIIVLYSFLSFVALRNICPFTLLTSHCYSHICWTYQFLYDLKIFSGLK